MKKLFILLVLVTSVFANIGTIMVTKGEAVLKRANDTLDAKAGMSLEQGDVIVTQAKSRVQVMLKDETVVTIGAKSHFSFDEYSFDGASSKVQMTASRGFFRSVTGRIGKLAPQRFKVKTASATIGIRGTDFWGITGGETEKITCNRGAISITFGDKVIEVGAGEYASYGAKGIEQGKSDAKADDAEEESADEGEDDGSEDDGGNDDSAGSGEEVLQDAIDSESLEVVVPTEDIADVVQGAEATQDAITEAFDITVNTEDRPVEY